MLSSVLDETTFGLSYFKVSVLAGLVVRCEPTLNSPLTGRVLSYDTTVTTSKNIWKNGDNFFIEISEGGWIVIKEGSLNACVRIKGPVIVSGDWAYEVVNPFGSRFAKSFNISEAKERHALLHKSGSIIKAIRKRTDEASAITMVQLDKDYGWVFEHSVTKQVLDRQGDELVVLPVDDNREFRDFYAKVINPNGIQILGTPIATSVSKGRLETDKIFQCCETLTVSIYPEGIDDATDPKHTTPVGVMQYFRLKDNRGWVLSTMRRNNELTGEKELSSQYTVEVVEVPAPKSIPSFPSSSSMDGKHIMPAPRAKMFHSPAPKSMSSRDMDEDSTLLGDGAFDTIGDPIAAPEIDTYDMEGDLGVGDRVIEDTPIEAWYRVVYHDGLRLRGSAAMHDVKDTILPFGSYVKASHRTVTVSRSQPSEGAGGAVIGSLFEQKGEKSTSRPGGSKSVYLKLTDCIGTDLDVEDCWIFETITDLSASSGSDSGVIVAAVRTNEPIVEIESSLLMVLHPTGVSLRATPHIESSRENRVVAMYDCIEASAMVSSPDKSEKFARVEGDFWLPCMSNGVEVVVEVPRQPHFRQGIFELTMKDSCGTLQGPYPESLPLSDVFPADVTLEFDLVAWYPTHDGSIVVSEVFYRLQQSCADQHVPDIWVRRDDSVLKIIERNTKA